ncbi:MAG: hypothetical protein ABI811_11115 [Acidobacteriota bacterium]
MIQLGVLVHIVATIRAHMIAGHLSPEGGGKGAVPLLRASRHGLEILMLLFLSERDLLFVTPPLLSPDRR